MITPTHVKLDDSQRYAFVKATSGGQITYVRLDDVYAALRKTGVGYSSLIADEIDAKIELFEELKTKGW